LAQVLISNILDKIKKFKKHIGFSILVTFLLLIVYSPILLLGESSYITIDDFLDDTFIHRYLLKTTNNLFSFNQDLIIPNTLNGLQLKFIHSQFNLYNLFLLFFDSFWSYIINSILTRTIGFISIFFLIKNNFSLNKYLNFLISISFSLLPVYTSYGITVLGLPLILNSFIQLGKSKNSLLGYLGIAFYAFYSLIQYSLPFIFLSVILGTIYFNKHLFAKNILYGLIFYLFISLLLNFSLIETVFSSSNQELTHRALRFERQIELPSISGMLFNFFHQMFFGSGKTNSLLISILIIIISLIKFNKRIGYIFIFIFFNIFLSTFYQHILFYVSPYFPIVASYDFSRIVQLNPFLFYLALIESLNNVNSKKTYILGGLILTAQIFLNYFRNPEFAFNEFKGINYSKNYFFEEDNYFRTLFNRKREIPFWNYKDSFKGYYSSELFCLIEKFINKDKKDYKIISFGINPSVTIYNGFYTLDGYFNNHSFEYHKQFEKIQNIELSNKLFLTDNALNSICLNCNKSYKIKDKFNLKLNISQLKKLDCSYIFSTVKIENDSELGIEFLKSFDHEDSSYIINLYKIL
tara:strand:- start:5230 stop:6966 length:1737 start_codon:yes stop_codon:yes gene_type:complete